MMPNCTEEIVGVSWKYGAANARIYLQEFGIDVSEATLYRAKEKQVYHAPKIPFHLEDHRLVKDAVDKHVSFIRV